MLITLAPNIDQIRWLAQSAYNGFEDLNTEDAIANAKSDLETLLLYLDGLNNADNAVGEFFISGIEPQIHLKGFVSDLDGSKQI